MINRLRREFQKEKWGGQVRLPWFLARMQIDYGLNPKTTRKYLASLEEVEEIKVDDSGGEDGKGIIMEWYDLEAIKDPLALPESESQEDGGMGV